MPVTSTTLAGTNVWQFSGAVTDAEIKTAWAGLIVNNRYRPNRTIYIDNTCSLLNVRGTYYVDAENLGVILHSSRNKANTLFSNWIFTQTVGLSVGSRGNFVRVTNGTTISQSITDGIDMKGGGMIYAVIGNPGGGDPRFLNEMMFGSLDGTVITSQAFTQQELQPVSYGTIWRGLNIQKCANIPIVNVGNQVVYRTNFNTEISIANPISLYSGSNGCFVSTVMRKLGATFTNSLVNSFDSAGITTIMLLNNWRDESYFGASRTNLTATNWSAQNRIIGGVLKKILIQPSTVIKTYDSRSNLYSQKSTFSETTTDFLTGSGTTNLLLQSEVLNDSAWTKGDTTIGINATTAPDGTLTADRVIENTANAQHRVNNASSIGVISGQAYTYSFYAKADQRNFVHARLITTGTNAQACFNLTNGTSIQSAGTTATITSVGNGWYRCSISAITDGRAATCYANLATSSSLTVPTYVGSTSNGLFLWGHQLQQGTTATEYLPTTTTRADGYYTTLSDASTGRASIVCVGAIATGGSVSITRYTGQQFTLQKFGYKVQIEAPDMTFGDDDLSAFSPITMTLQTGISRTQSAINAATSISNFQELLEELHVLAIGLSGSQSYSGYNNGNLFDFTGTELKTNFTTVNVDATASSKISYNATTNTLTIKASNLVGNSIVNSWNNSIGTVNLLNGAIIQGVYTTSAGTSTVLELNTPSNGYSLCIFKADGTTKYFASNVVTGSYYVYFTPSEAGTYYLGAENYGQKRTADTLVLSGGNVWYNITDQEDVGITDTKTTASAYTTLSTTSQIYDATAIFRLTETGIKLGQLVARDGLYLDFGTYNVKIKDDASAIVGVASGTITYKSIVINETSKYNAMKATPPKTITPTDTEIINVLIEDANGDSQLSILGGDNLGYELWKILESRPTDDYATGTLLATLETNATPFRFIGISGFDIVGRDVSSGVRRRSSMLKGSYEQAFYVGNQIQLATDAPQLLDTIDKLDELILKVDTNLDAAVSTRSTLTEIEASTILAKEATSAAIKAKTDKMEFNAQNHIAANVHQLQAGAINDIQDGLALEATSQEIKTKVDTLENYDDTVLIGKVDAIGTIVSDLENYDDTVTQGKLDSIQDTVDNISVDFTPVLSAVDALPTLSEIEAGKVGAIKTKVDTLNNTDLTGIATATNVTSAKDEIIAEIEAIPVVDVEGMKADLVIINENVKKASKIIPAKQNLTT
jgi:hypothetical protein